MSITTEHNLRDAATNVVQTVGTVGAAKENNHEMRSFKMVLVFFMGFVAFTIVSSCSKDETLNKNSYQTELRSNNLDSLSEKFQLFWNKAYTDVGMTTLCGCDCIATQSAMNFLNSNRGMLPLAFKNSSNMPFDCMQLDKILANDCKCSNINNFAMLVDSIINEAVISNLIGNSERILINNILNDSKVGLNNEVIYISDWESLPNNEPKYISLVVIQLSKATNSYVNNSPYFGTWPDKPQAIWNHLLSGVAGGLFAVFVACTRDTISDYGLDGNGVKNAFINGAIGGATRAL